MLDDEFPKVTVIIPTLNEEANIRTCLTTIFTQDYPAESLEVIIVDGNSSDNTVDIAKEYPVKVLYNPQATTGISRRMGVNAALGDIIAFIDADNELPCKNWLRRMITPLIGNNAVAGAIPIIAVKHSHPPASRLYSLMQANPLIALAFSTGKSINSDYIKIENYFPIGGNGIVIRKSAILEAGDFKSIKGQEDVDLTYRIVKLGYCFRVTDVGIYHLSHRTIAQLLNKIYVRILNYLNNYSSLSFRFIPSNKNSNLTKNFIMNIIFLKSFMRVIQGIREDRDCAWIYYPLVFYFSVFTFSIALLTNKQGLKIIHQVK